MTTVTTEMNSPLTQSYWKTLRHLIRREYWEYKTLYLWVPLVLSLCIASIFSYLAIETFFVSKHSTYDVAAMKSIMVEFYANFAWPLLWTISFVGLYHLMSSLHDDRQDRSVLFWKSLPVSDLQTVVAKISFPLVFGPLLVLVLSVLTYFVFCLLISAIAGVKGLNLFSVLLLDTKMWKMPLKAMSLLPIYIAWALPTVGWLLMVSAWSKSRVFPWAFGVPFLAMLILTFSNFHLKFGWDIWWILNNVFVRLLGGLLPGIWTIAGLNPQLHSEAHNMFAFNSVYTQAWEQFGGLKFWMGIVLGLAFIFIAVRQRRYAEAI